MGFFADSPLREDFVSFSLFYVMHLSSNRWSWCDTVIHCQICASMQFAYLWLVYGVEFWYYGICWYSSQGWNFDFCFLFLISCAFLLIGEVGIMQLFTVWFVLQLNFHVFDLFIFWYLCAMNSHWHHPLV